MDMLKHELRRFIIDTLKLEEISAEEIEDDAPLFGEEGLGLDSIDALELTVALEKTYGVTIPDEEVGKRAFASLGALAAHVLENRKEPS